jgi:methyl-accepting chemotaxis protein
MAEDPRRGIVEVMARLGRETQFHIDERYRHFQITDAVTVGISVLLVILAAWNVYHALILYKDLDGIVNNMESMYGHLRDVDADMSIITQQMQAFDQHTSHMEAINDHMKALSVTLPRVRANMTAITADTSTIEQNMALVSEGMGVMDHRVHLMVGGVAGMRENVRQIARPMGGMMPFVP